MIKTLLRDVTKKGDTVPTFKAGEQVEIKFDVKTKNGRIAHTHFSMNADGKRVVSRNLMANLGLRLPQLTLSKGGATRALPSRCLDSALSQTASMRKARQAGFSGWELFN